eukprot:m.338313 g.338313  ORF g.338313 m.338313 type:complete len:56 (+) comp18383_c0_seq1:40-207(+)
MMWFCYAHRPQLLKLAKTKWYTGITENNTPQPKFSPKDWCKLPSNGSLWNGQVYG